MSLSIYTLLFSALLLTGCRTAGIDLSTWSAQSENVTSMRILVESEGVDYGVYPISQDTIVFWSDRTGNSDIWMMAIGGGTGTVQVTSHNGLDISAAPHPNGKNYVFLSDRAGESDPYYYLGEFGKPSVVSLVSVSKPYLDYWQPAQVSPDGTTLLYVSGRYLWLYDFETRTKTQLVEGYEPAWFPDGKKIIFTRVARDLGTMVTTSIWTMNADGTNLTELIPGGEEVSVGHPRVSPDGTRVCFHRWTVKKKGIGGSLGGFLRKATGDVPLSTSSAADIWVADIDGTRQVQLTTHPLSDGSPAWMGNNRIIFSSERPTSGKYEERNWDIWILEL